MNEFFQVGFLLFVFISACTGENAFGRTPLMNALEKGCNERSDRDSIRAVIQQGGGSLHQPTINLKDNEGNTALMIAARKCENADIVNDIQSISGTNIHLTDPQGRTALILAARYNPSESVINTLLYIYGRVSSKSGRTIDISDDADNTALMTAAKYTQKSGVVETLLKFDPNYDLKNSDSKTALDLARENEHCGQEIVKVIEDYIANKLNPMRRTPLMNAVISCQRKEVKKLISEGDVSINKQDINGNTALMLAAQNCGKGENVDITEALLSVEGVKREEINQEGLTALMIASFLNDIDIIYALVKGLTTEERHRYLDMKSRDYPGYTALMYSVIQQDKANANPDAVRVLLKLGADPDLKDLREKTALMIAKGNRVWGETIVQILTNFVVHKKDPMRFEYGRNELMVAVQNADLQTVEKLLEAGVDINDADEFGNTALILAAISHKEKQESVAMTAIVKALLKHKEINVDQQTIDTRTALYYASVFGNTEIVKLLLDSNAQIDLCTSEAKKPCNFIEKDSEIFRLMNCQDIHQEEESQREALDDPRKENESRRLRPNNRLRGSNSDKMLKVVEQKHLLVGVFGAAALLVVGLLVRQKVFSQQQKQQITVLNAIMA